MAICVPGLWITALKGRPIVTRLHGRSLKQWFHIWLDSPVMRADASSVGPKRWVASLPPVFPVRKVSIFVLKRVLILFEVQGDS